jgi:hypothetical protein
MTNYRLLDQYLIGLTANGARVLGRADSWAMVAKGRRVNHVLHLLLTVITGTLWAPVWLLMIAIAGERRITVSSAGSAGIIEQKQPMELYRTAALAAAVVWGLWNLFAFGSIAQRLRPYRLHAQHSS